MFSTYTFYFLHWSLFDSGQYILTQLYYFLIQLRLKTIMFNKSGFFCWIHLHYHNYVDVFYHL